MRKRTKGILLRLTPVEIEALRERARLCGYPTETYLRELAFGHKPKAKPRDLESRAIHQLARIGNNLNQLTRAANAQRHAELSRRLKQVLDEVVLAIRRLA